jgi:hypothetical protein
VNGLAGRADLRNSGLARKPSLAAPLAFVQFDYVHVHNLYACVGVMPTGNLRYARAQRLYFLRMGIDAGIQGKLLTTLCV